MNVVDTGHLVAREGTTHDAGKVLQVFSAA